MIAVACTAFVLILAPPAISTSPFGRRVTGETGARRGHVSDCRKLEALLSNRIASAKDSGPDTQRRFPPPLTTTVCSPPARNTFAVRK